jgi:membrane-bound metal-dependent hydrolase YbcI (DUF457 family)
MFLGHIAVGFAGKRVAPKTSLGTLLLAPLFLDALWPIFLATGLERARVAPGATLVTPLDFEHYPWSHSLVMTLVWAAFFALAYRALKGSGRAAAWLAAAVLSHWIFDAVVHRPDLPLAPWLDTRVGFGLWNHRLATAAVELGLLALGLGIWLRSFRPRDRWGWIALSSLVVFLLAIFAGVLAGSPPPNMTAVIVSAFGLYILIPWAVWLDRHSRAVA